MCTFQQCVITCLTIKPYDPYNNKTYYVVRTNMIE